MTLDEIPREIGELKDRLAKLERRGSVNTSLDTARLDWLESNSADVIEGDGVWGVNVAPKAYPRHSTLREAIDAAMKGE